MREIVVLSGKGGTGKTTLSSAFAHLAADKVICDLDVDVPDLHIILDPDRNKSEEFFSGNLAQIDRNLCNNCGICAQFCNFKAISSGPDGYAVDPLRCEGCMVCQRFCPQEAVLFPLRHCGQWFSSSTRFGPMLHAQLKPGAENSGRLVALLKRKARELAASRGLDLIICDGSPGIGCPVISSLSGVTLAVLVVEPTLSGLHDLERVSKVCAHFKRTAAAVINKSDLNAELTSQIKKHCDSEGIFLVGELPYSLAATKSMRRRLAVTEDEDSSLSRAIRGCWERVDDLSRLANLGASNKL